MWRVRSYTKTFSTETESLQKDNKWFYPNYVFCIVFNKVQQESLNLSIDDLKGSYSWEDASLISQSQVSFSHRKQEFRRTNFGSRLLAAEGEWGGGRGQVWVRGVSEVKQHPSGSGFKSTAKVITAKFLLSSHIHAQSGRKEIACLKFSAPSSIV